MVDDFEARKGTERGYDPVSLRSLMFERSLDSPGSIA
jgi:hypothetical protein